MTAVGRTDGSNGAARTVGVAGIGGVVVFCGDVIGRRRAGEHEATLAVSHPHAELHAGKRREHHRIVLRDGKAEELRLELVRNIVLHARTLLLGGAFRVEQAELHHQLATVADAQREGVGAVVEPAECLACGVVPEEARSPSLGRTEHVGVRESAAEHYHVYVVESLAAAHEVGHMHVLHLETGEVERIGHLTVAVDPLLAYDGRTGAALLGMTVGQRARLQRAVECRGDGEAHRLLLVVPESGGGAFLAALHSVEQIRRLEPYVAEMVDFHQMPGTTVLHDEHTLGARGTNCIVTASGIGERFLHNSHPGIVNLKHHRGILGEENLYEVGLAGFYERICRDGDTAVGVGESHFEQSGDQTAGRHIVHGQHAAVAHQRLYGGESLFEISGVGHRGHVGAYGVERLSQCRASEPQSVGREINV